MINWKVRFKNPLFVSQIVLSVLAPILAYYGLTAHDITSWATLGKLLVDALSNPFVLSLVLVSVWGTINDPTTEGMSDSEQALTYEEPKKDGE